MLDFWCGFSDIFILSCGIAVLQNQAVCGIQKLRLAVFLFYFVRCLFVILCDLRYSYPSYAPLGSTLFFNGFSFSFFVIFLISDGTVKLTFLVVFHAL